MMLINGVLELHEQLDQELLNFITTIQNQESSTVTVLENFVELLLSSLNTCIAKIGLNTAAIANYESNSFYTDKDVYTLANISQVFYQQHEDNKDVYEAMLEAEQNLKDAAQERETQGIGVWDRRIDIEEILCTCAKRGVKSVEEINQNIKLIRDFYESKIKAFIPQNIDNKSVLEMFDILQKANFISEKVRKDNVAENREELRKKGYIPPDGFYIENQAHWEKVRFGNSVHSNMSYSGCEIIATYNALSALGNAASADTMISLIEGYEKTGAMFNGEFGVNSNAIADYFRKEGYVVDMIDSTDVNIINQLGSNNDVIIVTVYNDQNDISQMIHTVCITKTDEGKYVAHNIYKQENSGIYVSSDEKTTLEEAIQCIGSDPAIISTIGVKQALMGDFPKYKNTSWG
ncbi:MAG: hypothetical protein MRZ75_00850 [Roseburia sp.]|nr:hypothetical protein [Roseburia sp.]